jgi:hypothetical protein
MRRLRWWVAAGMAVLMLVLAVPQFSGTMVLPEFGEPRDCPMIMSFNGPPGGAVVEPEDRERMYLCYAPRHFGELPDEELLARGGELCDSDVGADEELMRLLELRCPGLYERNAQASFDNLRKAEAAEEAEERRRLAVAKAGCPRRKPIARPVRQSRAVMWVTTGGIQAWEEGYGALDHTGEFLSKGKGTVHLTWGGEEAGTVCVTGESYRKAPPRVKGWERSGELGFRSLTGVVNFFGDGGDLLGDVTAGGAGPYRIRAYVRGPGRALAKADAIREVLIVVFPA